MFNNFKKIGLKSLKYSKKFSKKNFFSSTSKRFESVATEKAQSGSFFQKLGSLNPFKENLHVKFPLQDNDLVAYRIYKYDPSVDEQPYIKTFYLKKSEQESMLLSNLFKIKDEKDESLAFRRSCREGICGSCAMNINGENALACLYKTDENISYLRPYVNVYPLPHMPVIRDLVVCMKHFYSQYKTVEPYLKTRPFEDNLEPLLKLELPFNLTVTKRKPKVENYQSKEDRKLLDGLYECILCACCSTSCPSYWWNRDKYLGPALLLQSYRWIIDSRDEYTLERLENLDDLYRLYRCHTILNCTRCCPKSLNPAEAIANVKDMLAILKNSK